MKDTVRICMIGAGGMANSVHYPSLRSFDDVEIVGVCEMNRERLDATSQEFGIPEDRRYHAKSPENYKEMVAALKPDGVYVIGQPNIMYDIWVWCLENKYNLYIEKPMGLTRHQARILSYLAEQNGCITQVSHQRRTVPLLHEMRDELLKKGPIVHGVVEFFKCAPKPATGARDHMMDDCTHSVDTARWMCGGEVVRIESHCKRVGTPDINWIGATLHFDNGSTCFIVNTWVSGRRIFRVQMHSQGAYVDAEIEGKAYLYADGDYEGQVFSTEEVSGSGENYVYGGFRNKNREFIDSLKSGVDTTSSPFRDTVKTMEVCETILANALLAGE
ncbi:MAG: Gfo/Idh/MocA family oxidoreductase [Spirochaetales bacterium]|jgi:virulence factor|nr:Gfo/Idh/MocA family oxidoreductase [Spirochaetales bacterium]